MTFKFVSLYALVKTKPFNFLGMNNWHPSEHGRWLNIALWGRKRLTRYEWNVRWKLITHANGMPAIYLMPSSMSTMVPPRISEYKILKECTSSEIFWWAPHTDQKERHDTYIFGREILWKLSAGCPKRRQASTRMGFTENCFWRKTCRELAQDRIQWWESTWVVTKIRVLMPES